VSTKNYINYNDAQQNTDDVLTGLQYLPRKRRRKIKAKNIPPNPCPWPSKGTIISARVGKDDETLAYRYWAMLYRTI